MSDQPNIIAFVTDDHAQWAAGCYGARGLYSPSMNHLAQTGARLTHAVTPSPVCSPARACFYTGRLPSMHGVHDWLSEKKSAADHPGIKDQPTLANHLGALGYDTSHFGKWHCGQSWVPQPGFDHWDAASQAHYGDNTFWPNGETQTVRGHRDSIVTDRALRYLSTGRQTEKPFFMSVAYTATHSAFAQQPERLVRGYRQLPFDDIPDEQPVVHGNGFPRRGRPERDEEHEWRAQYYAAVTFIDEQIGRMLDQLDAMGQRENTLIVYTSDHGHMNGHHGLWCKGNATVPQNFYEESIHVPCLISWPDRVKAEQTVSLPVDHCDTFATLIDAAGGDWERVAKEVRSPGQSYLGALSGKPPEDWKRVQVCEYGNARMASDGRFKLIRRYPGSNGHYADELYDLQNDPRERTSCIDDEQNTAIVAALSRHLDEHFAMFEDAEQSGLAIGEAVRCNLGEPWHVTEPDKTY